MRHQDSPFADTKVGIGDAVSHFRRFVKEHRLLRHRFLAAAREGQLHVSDLRVFAVQEMFVSVAFPAMMAEVVCRIPYRREELRYPLIANMFEEAGERDPGESHPALLRRLAISLGVAECDIELANPIPETDEYLKRLFALCRNRSYVEGLAAIGYGNEYLVLFEYPVFKKACARLGYADDVLRFFDANIQADVEHTDNIERVLVAAAPKTDGNEIVRAIDEALEARYVFYDGLCRCTTIG